MRMSTTCFEHKYFYYDYESAGSFDVFGLLRDKVSENVTDAFKCERC